MNTQAIKIKKLHLIPDGPYDRGSANRYYGRKYNPHKRELTQQGYRYDYVLNEQETAEYAHGWEQETDRKDWGTP